MRRAFFAVLFVLAAVLPSFLVAGCRLARAAAPEAVPGAEWMDREAASVLDAMSVTERASQALMACVDGKDAFSPAMRERFRGRVPGAVLLFAYNIASTPERVRSFVDSCDASFERLGARASVLFAIDHEGGDVVRTRGLTSPLPSARSAADTFDPKAAETLYALSGTQLAALGIDLNLAPVAETLDEENEAFLGTRSYSGDPSRVVEYAAAAIRGYRSAGITTSLKHFPGSGSSDPHASLTRLDATASGLMRSYAAPFAALTAEQPDSILVSHVIVPSVDDRPFSLSRSGVTGILRERMKYDGLVITDDVAMAALADCGYSAPEAAVLAIEAGCDLVMVSVGELGPIVREIAERASSDPDFSARLDESVLRLLKLKARYGLVKTARERYCYSRYGRDASVKKNRAHDPNRFKAAKRDAQALMGEQ